MTIVPNEDMVQDHFTIEGLRNLYGSCFSCGVSWQQDHVSLDCRECGGYAMARPCPACDGRCKSQWRRNISASHSSQVAAWDGRCTLSDVYSSRPNKTSSETSTPITTLKKQSKSQIVTPLKVS